MSVSLCVLLGYMTLRVSELPGAGSTVVRVDAEYKVYTNNKALWAETSTAAVFVFSKILLSSTISPLSVRQHHGFRKSGQPNPSRCFWIVPGLHSQTDDSEQDNFNRVLKK